MHAGAVGPKYWFQRFMECPAVSHATRQRLGEHCRDYPEVRRFLLKEYGPRLPTSFWKHELRTPFSGTGEEVAAALRHIQSLHNRAAADLGLAAMTDGDLVYPFCDSFPPHIREQLRSDLHLLKDEDAFAALVRRAPGPTSITNTRSATVFSTQPGRGIRRPPPNGNTFPLEKRRAFEGHRAADGPSRACFNCGRAECRNRAECVAKDVTCRTCGRLGHYARCCRSGRRVVAIGSQNFRSAAKLEGVP